MELRQYQKDDVNEIIKHDSIGIFNEQRTGKTPTSLTAMVQKANKIIIVCPASMVNVWQYEAELWTDYKAYTYTGYKKQREKKLKSFQESEKAFLVVSYSLFRSTKISKGLLGVLSTRHIDGLIVDEAHRAVGRKTATFKSLRTLVSRVRHRYYLTGTPAPNHPSQIWALLTMIAPKEFPSYWNFVDEFFYMDTIYTPNGDIQQPGEFRTDMDVALAKLVSEYSIMRKRIDVMPWLPSKPVHRRIALEPSPKLLNVFDNLDRYFAHEHLVTQSVLTRLGLYRMLCDDPSLKDLKIKSPKTEWVGQFIKDYPDDNIIFLSRFRTYLELLHDKYGGSIYTGKTTLDQRTAIIKSFQTTTGNKLFLQIDAGKEGITLDNADALVFLDIYPPAADNLQAQDRIVATRADRVKDVRVYELMLKGTYDENLYQLVQDNISLTNVVNDYKRYIERS